MARVRLANWFRGSAPGAVVEVADDEVPGLRRDGRVAEVLGDDPAASAAVPALPVETTEPGRVEGLPDAESPKPRRRSKSDE